MCYNDVLVTIENTIKFLSKLPLSYAILVIRKAPTSKVGAPNGIFALMSVAYPVGMTG